MELENLEKAENKVLILYFFDKVGMPVSNMQLTRMMLEGRYMNYFLLQQSLHEMVKDNMLLVESRENIDYYTPSSDGLRMLEMFPDLLAIGIKKRMDELIASIRYQIRHEASVIADYTLENEDEYDVRCRIIENNKPLVDIRLSVGSREDARYICNNWKACAKEIYPQVIGVLLGRDKEEQE